MTDRLTHTSSPPSATRRSAALPWLLLAAVTLFWLLLPIAPAAAVESGSRWFALLSQGTGTSLRFLQIAGAAALLTSALALTGFLLPAKRPPGALAAARCMILICLVIPLHPWWVESFSGSPLPLSMALMFGSWAAALASQEKKRTPLAGLAGLLGGLAAGLSLLALSGLLPLGSWMLLRAFRSGKTPAIALLLFLLGAAAGLAPELDGLAARLPDPQAFDLAHPLSALRSTGGGLGIAGLLFLALGLFAGLFQKQPVILGLLLPCWLLQKLLLGFSGTPNRLLGASMIIPCMLLGYGLYRLVRGLENGLQSVHAAQAKQVMRITPWILLLVFTFWAWRQFQ